MKQNQYDGVARQSMVNSIEVNSKGGMDLYGAQYDPNNDFAVFGVGDPTRGGIQSMKEKMNLADSVDLGENVEDIIDEVNSENEVDYDPTPKGKNNEQFGFLTTAQLPEPQVSSAISKEPAPKP